MLGMLVKIILKQPLELNKLNLTKVYRIVYFYLMKKNTKIKIIQLTDNIILVI